MTEHMTRVRMRQDDREIEGWYDSRFAREGQMIEVRILDGLWEIVEVLSASPHSSGMAPLPS